MTEILYYKATRPDGTDFRTGMVSYAGALETGLPVMHPTTSDMRPNLPSTYLSISVEPAETLVGGKWPCRLFRVEPIGPVLVRLQASRYKRACSAMRVVEELEAWRALGPNGREVAQFIEEIPSRLRYAAWDAARSAAQDEARYAAWGAARNAAWDAARNAAGGAAWDAARYAAWDAASGAAQDAAWGAAWDAARDAARDAALALTVTDLIRADQFDTLMKPWRILMGEHG